MLLLPLAQIGYVVGQINYLRPPPEIMLAPARGSRVNRSPGLRSHASSHGRPPVHRKEAPACECQGRAARAAARRSRHLAMVSAALPNSQHKLILHIQKQPQCIFRAAANPSTRRTAQPWPSSVVRATAAEPRSRFSLSGKMEVLVGELPGSFPAAALRPPAASRHNVGSADSEAASADERQPVSALTGSEPALQSMIRLFEQDACRNEISGARAAPGHPPDARSALSKVRFG